MSSWSQSYPNLSDYPLLLSMVYYYNSLRQEAILVKKTTLGGVNLRLIFPRRTRKACFKQRNAHSDLVNISISLVISIFARGKRTMEAEDCLAFLLYQNEPGSHVCTVQVLWHTQITKMRSAVFTLTLKSCLGISLVWNENFNSVRFAFTVYGYMLKCGFEMLGLQQFHCFKWEKNILKAQIHVTSMCELLILGGCVCVFVYVHSSLPLLSQHNAVPLGAPKCGCHFYINSCSQETGSPSVQRPSRTQRFLHPQTLWHCLSLYRGRLYPNGTCRKIQSQTDLFLKWRKTWNLPPIIHNIQMGAAWLETFVMKQCWARVQEKKKRSCSSLTQKVYENQEGMQ